MFGTEAQLTRAIELIEEADAIQQGLMDQDEAFDIHMALLEVMSRLEDALEEMETESGHA